MRYLSCLFLLPLFLASCQPWQRQHRTELQSLQREIDQLIAQDSIPGISLAVFDRKGVRWQTVAGYRDREQQRPVTTNTVFEAASLSKTVTAYLVADLVAAGRLAWDTPIARYYPGTELLDEERRQALTPRILLSHTSGLPNWRGRVNIEAPNYDSLFAPTDTLRLRFAPGERFSYSGEGYVYLQRVLETLTGLPFETLAAAQIFAPLHMDRTSFVFRPDMEGDHALPYQHRDSTAVLKRKPTVPLAAATLHTTAADFARFFSHLLQRMATEPAFAELVQPQVTVTTKDDYRVDWGLGIGVVQQGERTYYFHWGDNYFFKAYYCYAPGEDIGLVYFIHQVNGLALRDRLVAPLFEALPPMYPDDY